jgi:hypothetical protein
MGKALAMQFDVYQQNNSNAATAGKAITILKIAISM